MFQAQKKLKLTGAVLHRSVLSLTRGADAVYCFVAGHCNNTEIEETATASEATKVCDKLYGERRAVDVVMHSLNW